MHEWAFVLYAVEEAGTPLWHQRLRLGRLACSETEVAIVTPDGDIYFEEHGAASTDIAAIREGVEWWPPPVGVPRSRTYRFPTKPTEVEILRWRVEAENVAKAEHRARGHRLVGGVGLVPLGRESRQGDGGGAVDDKKKQKVEAADTLELEDWVVYEDVTDPSWFGKRVSEVAPGAEMVFVSGGRAVCRLGNGREFFAHKSDPNVKRGGDSSSGDARVLPLVRVRESRWRD